MPAMAETPFPLLRYRLTIHLKSGNFAPKTLV